MNPDPSPSASGIPIRDATGTAASSTPWPLVEDAFIQPELPGAWMDSLWSQGWRHFGSQFFRYSVTLYEDRVVPVIPLRMDLRHWTPSKSQRRILRRNQDVEVQVGRPQVGPEHHRLFEAHRGRFKSNIPESLENFIGPDPGRQTGRQGYPCECREVSVRRDGTLIAFSFLDIGQEAASSVYGCFDPAESDRSLGIATLLWEALHAQAQGLRYLYPGYAYTVKSPYDYKKRLGALEVYDWTLWRRWEPS